MIRFLLHAPVRWCHPLWRLYARLRRASVHPTVRMNGRPLIRCVRGAELRIESGVTIHSRVRSNPVMGRSTSALSAVAPGARLWIGPGVGMSGVCITAAREIVIGEDSILGADTLITDTDFHSRDAEGRWNNDALASARPVHIGRRCFIGARAIILKGVTLGDGVVVGAGSVVTHDVPSNHLAVGNPASIRPLPTKWRQQI